MLGERRRAAIRPLVERLLRTPARRLAGMFVAFDQECAVHGWHAAARSLQAGLVDETRVQGAGSIPPHGPLMVVCNHPGAYDVVILSAAIPRSDIRIISSDIRFLHRLPNAGSHFLMIADSLGPRVAAVRSAHRHLASGGMLLFFPRGEVEPDPAFAPDPGRELGRWSPSVELFLRLVPATQVVAAAAGGMLARRWFYHPLVRLWKDPFRRQKVAEVFQVATHLMGHKTSGILPTVSFSPPFAHHAKTAPKGALLSIVTDAVLKQMTQVSAGFSDAGYPSTRP